MVFPTVFLPSNGFTAEVWPKRSLKSHPSLRARASLPALSHVDAIPTHQFSFITLSALRFWPGQVAITLFFKVTVLASQWMLLQEKIHLLSFSNPFFSLVLCSVYAERFSQMTQGCKHNHPKMENIFPLSYSLLLFEVFSEDAKTTISLHLLSPSVPKFKRGLNQLKTIGQQNSPCILFKGCRSPEDR